MTSEEFVITVNYDKEKFEHNIDEYVSDIIKEAQKSDLYEYNYVVHRPLSEEIEDSSSSFLHSVVITITVNSKQKKKKKCLCQWFLMTLKKTVK